MDNSVVERFWANVDKSDLDKCWPWKAGIANQGYGRFYLCDGRKMVSAHRVAYELATGQPPGEMSIDHMCHNQICCNPSHLRLVTCKQNNENLAGAYRNCKSGMRGVYLHQGRWRAQVYHNGRKFSAGCYSTPEEAAEAARIKRLELFTHNEIDKKETANV